MRIQRALSPIRNLFSIIVSSRENGIQSIGPGGDVTAGIKCLRSAIDGRLDHDDVGGDRDHQTVAACSLRLAFNGFLFVPVLPQISRGGGGGGRINRGGTRRGVNGIRLSQFCIGVSKNLTNDILYHHRPYRTET